MAVDQISLGAHYYLFEKRASSSTVAMITAHGAAGATQDVFAAPIDIGFYQLRNNPLEATRDIALYKPLSWVRRGHECDEHYLSKFQGRHGNNFETYASLAEWVEENDIAALTVRNRKNPFLEKYQPKLSDAAMFLRERGYREVRCSFCRVPSVAEYIRVLPTS